LHVIVVEVEGEEEIPRHEAIKLPKVMEKMHHIIMCISTTGIKHQRKHQAVTLRR
jgi:hypothetical protein